MSDSGELAAGRRPTRLIVDTQAIGSNAAIILEHLTPSTRLMAVVKANGYGHGAVASALAALSGGATELGVSTVSEARQLREAGISAPILVLGSTDPAEAPEAARLGIAIGVGDLTQASRMLSVFDGADIDRALKVHLKIDTGMRRFGVSPDVALKLASELVENPAVEFSGVYSHFAESDDESTERMDAQLVIFTQILAQLAKSGLAPPIAHISNSAAILRNRSADFGLVRAGICLYGISPSPYVALFPGMKPALEWRATVQHIAEMSPGDRAGYGGTYVATGHERIALLPIGYADGYPRHLSNVGWMGFAGRRLPIRGRISMDQCTVGIPPGVDLDVGDEVTVIGPPDSGAPSANELGESIGTIGYEIVARLSQRVPVDYM